MAIGQYLLISSDLVSGDTSVIGNHSSLNSSLGLATSKSGLGQTQDLAAAAEGVAGNGHGSKGGLSSESHIQTSEGAASDSQSASGVLVNAVAGGTGNSAEVAVLNHNSSSSTVIVTKSMGAIGNQVQAAQDDGLAVSAIVNFNGLKPAGATMVTSPMP